MLVTDVGDQMCWCQVWYVDDRFRMSVIDLINSENHQHNKKVANITILPSTSQISHHYKVTNITMSPTSLSPIFCFILSKFEFWTHLWCNFIQGNVRRIFPKFKSTSVNSNSILDPLVVNMSTVKVIFSLFTRLDD